MPAERTFHFHIQGIVQGVGFRPWVYRMAQQAGIRGWVKNTVDGVHILANFPDVAAARRFLQQLVDHPPPQAVITAAEVEEVPHVPLSDFQIVHSEASADADLWLTPDFALCDECRNDLHDPTNRRFQYPFTTCTACGPRYSIITALPYDRPHTTMAPFDMCPECRREYDDPLDRRYYSQTNSCPRCPIPLAYWTPRGVEENFTELGRVVAAWRAGRIVAVKGIGGYLLTCDATNEEAVQRLRRRKRRPTKPLAVMFPSLETAAQEVEIPEAAARMLTGPVAPIVLLRRRQRRSELAESIAPGLGRLGVMLPYAPLFEILLRRFGRPIVATSGNISGETIVYSDAEAVDRLADVADEILMYRREIVVPQDDSVVQWADRARQRIILRRSRGWAPAYLGLAPPLPKATWLAMGALLKSAWAMAHRGRIFISQYLGDTDDWHAQQNYEAVRRHLQRLLGAAPEVVLVDAHPDYFATRRGRTLAREWGVPVVAVQHHRAHLWAVLAENRLWDASDPVLGVVWDGLGLGDDGRIWGGEFLAYQSGQVQRIAHMPYFPYLGGDRMARMPALAALAIAGPRPELQPHFSEQEWRIYSRLREGPTPLESSSIGRLFDAAAGLLLGIGRQSYEGEAAMRLEARADAYFRTHAPDWRMSYFEGSDLPANWPAYLLECLAEDRTMTDRAAARFHVSLVDVIRRTADAGGFRNIAFSGGVFQNAVLVDLLHSLMAERFQLYFHRELSPNDENIAFGQLICYLCEKSSECSG